MRTWLLILGLDYWLCKLAHTVGRSSYPPRTSVSLWDTQK